MDKLIYCIDIDGTICTMTENHDYHKAMPIQGMITKINKLYDEGHMIKIATARGQGSGIDQTELTKKQLKKWKVKYHELLKKTSADFYVDDKSMVPTDFLLGKDYNICLEGNLEKRGFLPSAVQLLKPPEKS